MRFYLKKYALKLCWIGLGLSVNLLARLNRIAILVQPYCEG